MDARVKRDKKPPPPPPTYAHFVSEGGRAADIISANCETVNCGKRGPVKAINVDRTAAAASNFFLPLKNS